MRYEKLNPRSEQYPFMTAMALVKTTIVERNYIRPRYPRYFQNRLNN